MKRNAYVQRVWDFAHTLTHTLGLTGGAGVSRDAGEGNTLSTSRISFMRYVKQLLDMGYRLDSFIDYGAAAGLLPVLAILLGFTFALGFERIGEFKLAKNIAFEGSKERINRFIKANKLMGPKFLSDDYLRLWPDCLVTRDVPLEYVDVLRGNCVLLNKIQMESDEAVEVAKACPGNQIHVYCYLNGAVNKTRVYRAWSLLQPTTVTVNGHNEGRLRDYCPQLEWIKTVFMGKHDSGKLKFSFYVWKTSEVISTFTYITIIFTCHIIL
jgi:hypothetical protein